MLLPDRDGELELTEVLVPALCDRRAGIGGDGVIRVAPGPGRRLVHGLPQRRRIDRRDVRERRPGVRQVPRVGRLGAARTFRLPHPRPAGARPNSGVPGTSGSAWARSGSAGSPVPGSVTADCPGTRGRRRQSPPGVPVRRATSPSWTSRRAPESTPSCSRTVSTSNSSARRRTRSRGDAGARAGGGGDPVLRHRNRGRGGGSAAVVGSGGRCCHGGRSGRPSRRAHHRDDRG